MEEYLRAHEAEFVGGHRKVSGPKAATTDSLEIDIWQDFEVSTLQQRDYSHYDIIFRSPSVPPLHLPQETSLTRYFFDHCPCQIIGVTGTKGKGTTCSFIKALLDAHGYDAHLVGNIGNPAIEVLDRLTPESVVVYEMSSFQLWDLPVSPHIAVVGLLEPDHLNVHRDLADYLGAKAHIAEYQTENDYLIYYEPNASARHIAELSEAVKVPYPFELPEAAKQAVRLPGEHNLRNAMAAIAAVASFKNISPDEYLRGEIDTICEGLKSFHGLPHRLQFLRTLKGVKYYDDNFATGVGSTEVAVNAFPEAALFVIAGGRDKTNYEDLPELQRVLQAPQVQKVFLIGESGHELVRRFPDERFVLCESLEEAVTEAQRVAQAFADSSAREGDTEDNSILATQDSTASFEPIVLMSPAAASFDMFENVYDRGAKYQKLVADLQ